MLVATPTPSACRANLWNVFLFLSMIYRCERKRKSMSAVETIKSTGAEAGFEFQLRRESGQEVPNTLDHQPYLLRRILLVVGVGSVIAKAKP
jgi:hypothetical protein